MKMTPKEKAIELINKFYPFTWQVCEDYEKDNEQAKQCALIMVDEMDSLIQRLTPIDDQYMYLQILEYYQDVKKEIINYGNES